MGCCEGRSDSTTASKQPIMHEPKPCSLGRVWAKYGVSHGQLEEKIEVLGVLRTEKKLSELGSLITDPDQVDSSRITFSSSSKIYPSSVGCLALSFLADLAETESEAMGPVVRNHAEALVSYITGPTNDARHFTLLLVYNTLMKPIEQLREEPAGENSDTEEEGVLSNMNAARQLTLPTRDALLAAGIFPALLGFFRSQSKFYRQFAAYVASSIYECYPKAQNEFFRLKGEVILVQLLKRDEEDEKFVIDVLGMLEDLIFVIPI